MKETVQSIFGKRVLVSRRLSLFTGFCDLDLYSVADQILRSDINLSTLIDMWITCLTSPTLLTNS